MTPTPSRPRRWAAPLSQRFVLIVLDQADRDLAKGDPKINMMFDTQTGRSWILEYSRKPNSNGARLRLGRSALRKAADELRAQRFSVAMTSATVPAISAGSNAVCASHTNHGSRESGSGNRP